MGFHVDRTPFRTLNYLESLSGIETSLDNCSDRFAPLSITLNPYQGLKLD